MKPESIRSAFSFACSSACSVGPKAVVVEARDGFVGGNTTTRITTMEVLSRRERCAMRTFKLATFFYGPHTKAPVQAIMVSARPI
jgi:hypothetical protein